MGHAEHAAEHSVQADTQSEIRTIFLRQLVEQVAADFVEHPAEVFELANALARATKGRVDHANNSFTEPGFSNASPANACSRLLMDTSEARRRLLLSPAPRRAM